MSREPDPTPIRPGATGSFSSAELEQRLADEQRIADAAIRRWLLAAARKIATLLGLPLAGAGTGYMAASAREHAPVERQQAPSGPAPLDPTECTPGEQRELVEAEDRAARDARAAVDACNAMADACRPHPRDHHQ